MRFGGLPVCRFRVFVSGLLVGWFAGFLVCWCAGLLVWWFGWWFAGTVIQATLGNHDGFQYVVDIDNSEKDSAFVQGDKTPLSNGQRVIIIYGNDVRILPYQE